MLSGFIITLVLVALNGFFVAAEFAIVKVRASQIEIQAKSGSSVAKLAKHISANLDRYIAATQLGITLASLALGWVGEHTFQEIVSSVFSFFGFSASLPVVEKTAFGVAFLTITMLHIIFGELAPKSYALQRPVAVTMAVSFPLHVFYLIFRPLIWLLNEVANVLIRMMGIKIVANEHDGYHTSEELQYLLEQGKESGALDSTEHEMIQNVFDFNERIVKNIIVPRTKISAIEINATRQELLDILIKEGYSRMPIYEGSIDKIIGIVHAKDILPLLVAGGDFQIRDIVRKPFFVPETKKINDLLGDMRTQKIQMAIVIDEFGGTDGLVTLEDIVEELVGEIQDEYDEEKPIVEKISEKEFIVNASATIYDVNEYLPHDLPENENYDTISGMVSNAFAKIPDAGEQVEFHGYLITVIRKQHRNIEAVKFELLLEKEDQKDLR